MTDRASQRLEPVAHSAGTRPPRRALPDGACDAHMHIFDPRFAPSPHWRRVPPVATVEIYGSLQQRLGTRRAVVVTPSTYGTDNRCTLDALERMGANARGVAVIHPDVPAAELRSLDQAAIRGLRVNFVSPQPWGETTEDLLSKVAVIAADRGWHVQLFATPARIVAMAPLLSRLPTPLVIDHLGSGGPDHAQDAGAADVILRLLDRGNAWIKLSGAYMHSRDGAPGYRDLLAWGRTLARHAPDRLVWGSDWPHTTASPGSVDDAHLVDLLDDWCDDATLLRRVLVDNAATLYGFD